MHRPVVRMLAVGLTIAAGAAQAENTVSWQTYKYVESDDRIRVMANNLAVEKEIGTDFTLRFDTGADAISGATPAWCAKSGYVNEYQSCTARVADETRHALGGGLSWRDARRNEYSFGVALSKEPDYDSRELSVQAQLWHDADHNRSYTFGASVQRNINIANAHTNNLHDEDSHVWNVQAGVNQVLDKSNTIEASVFGMRSSGFLSNDYLKIVRDDGAGAHVLAPDSRPDTRNAGGVALRWIRSWRTDLSSNLWYRHYQDSWGVRGNTIELKLYWDVSPKWRLNPVLRWHTQQGADFYRGYGEKLNTFAATGYGTNDARQGPMQAKTAQFHIEYRPDQAWSLNVGVARYVQDTGLKANWLTAGFVLHY